MSLTMFGNILYVKLHSGISKITIQSLLHTFSIQVMVVP